MQPQDPRNPQYTPQNSNPQPPQYYGGYQPNAPQNFSPMPVPTPPPRMKRYDQPPLPIRIVDWIKKNWWAPVVGLLILLLVSNVIYQVAAYPASALAPGLKVDGNNFNKAKKEDVVRQLDEGYSKVSTEMYFGSASVAYKISEAKELGIVIENSDRFKNASYPLWLRLIPTSVWWAAALAKVESPIYKIDRAKLDGYINKEIGSNCQIQPKDASLKLEDGQFVVVSAVPGGVCNISEFRSEVQKVRVDEGKIKIRSSMKETDAKLKDEHVRAVADKLNKNLAKNFTVIAGEERFEVSGSTIKNWLVFETITPEGGEPSLSINVDEGRLQKYLTGTTASRLEKKPGNTTITTKDYTLISQVNGANGAVFDISKIITSIKAAIEGQSSEILIGTKEVGPTVKYNRSYSPTEAGFKALVEHFAHDNQGKIGIVLHEDSGKKPLINTAINDQVQLPSNGFEAIYIAYAAQIGIENGSLQPTDKIAGSLSIKDCMKEAVSEQSQDCIKALLTKIGNGVVQQRLVNLGLTGTTLSGDTFKTTARDMSIFMQKHIKHTNGIKQTSDLDNMMSNNRYRDGMVGILGGNTSSQTVVGAGEAGFADMVLANSRGRFIVTYISDNKDPKQARELIQAIERLRTEKNNLK